MTNTSIILAALEQAWEKIRKQHKDVPAGSPGPHTRKRTSSAGLAPIRFEW